MSAIISTNVKVDVVNKENVERQKINALFNVKKTKNVHTLIAVEVGTA